jgi:hypothetical protein
MSWEALALFQAGLLVSRTLSVMHIKPVPTAFSHILSEFRSITYGLASLFDGRPPQLPSLETYAYGTAHLPPVVVGMWS